MTLDRIGMEVATRLPTDKLDSGLFEFYEPLFAPIRVYPVRLLELGVQHGGALVSYARYFRNGFVLGADTDGPRLRKLQRYLDRTALAERVRIEAGDVADGMFLRTICVGLGPHPLDIVIDDASHQYAQARASLSYLWPRLRPGGLYIVEDWHAAYWDERYAVDGGLPAILNTALKDMALQHKGRLPNEIIIHRRAFAMRKMR